MLDKKYNHIEVEKDKYDSWVKSGYFEQKEGDNFCIVLPPPNVTGKLHLGHAWNTTIQDIIIRFKKMQGFNAIWVPGMDHAGIATQAKVDAKLKEMGINPRSLQREEWLKYAWDWKGEYALNIRNQWAKLGLSLCYSKEKFTLDGDLCETVKHVFVKMYEDGLIYRGERIINWDPVAMTALSNEEVFYKEVKGNFYYLKYYLEDSDEYLVVATTRPETIFGDTALAIHPEDERYLKYVGKNVVIPIVNKKIPIIKDEYVEQDFGTGVVKITPAHDLNDFEVGKRHNLDSVVVMNLNGTMNELALNYEGLDRFVCQEKLIEDLKNENLVEKIEEIVHNVGFSERSEAVVEPLLSKQWFVKMRPLADKVLENQLNKETKVNFVPKRYEKIMNHWMTITYDWCISRQLWWGHRIPAWYKEDEIYVGINPPSGEGWIQDEDVLDTWFSSALWPFSTLGWPNKTDDLAKFYPNNVLVTGYDIIPFWVNRMTFQGLYLTEKRPFKDCLIHGLIRDKHGRKMSKSLGNGVDPMDVIDTYGADSLRFFLTTQTALGLDLRYDEEKVKSTWNFINKLWNASRFVLMNITTLNETNYSLDNLNSTDKWILTKLEKTIKTVTKNMENYEFHNAGKEIYNFTWNIFCDNYIEISKYRLNEISVQSVLLKILTDILKMLHPFMPYVTDEIYEKLPIKDKNIIISKYPIYEKKYIFKEDEEKIDDLIIYLKMLRNKKIENNIPKDVKIKLNNDNDYSLILKLLKYENNIIKEDLNINKINVSYKDYNLDLYYDEVKDLEKIKKKKEELEISIKKRENLLNNDNFVKKAPQELVEKEKKLLELEKDQLAKIDC